MCIRDRLDLADEDQATTRTLSVAGVVCAVHMYEMAVEEIYDEEEDKIAWPERLGQKQIHGVMTLYDVGHKAGFRQVPEVLSEWARDCSGKTCWLTAACRCGQ